jgi:hypothetical protein
MRENPDKLCVRSVVPAIAVVLVIGCVGDEAKGIDQDRDDLFPHGVSPFASVLLPLHAAFKRAYRRLGIT